MLINLKSIIIKHIGAHEFNLTGRVKVPVRAVKYAVACDIAKQNKLIENRETSDLDIAHEVALRFQKDYIFLDPQNDKQAIADAQNNIKNQIRKLWTKIKVGVERLTRIIVQIWDDFVAMYTHDHIKKEREERAAIIATNRSKGAKKRADEDYKQKQALIAAVDLLAGIVNRELLHVHIGRDL